MKECFQEKDFSPEHLAIIQQVNDILEEYEAEGYDLTLRQLYYQFVSRDIFPADRKWKQIGNGKWVRDPNGTINAEPNYKWLGDIIGDARLAGLVDWDAIKDRGRARVSPFFWDSPQQAVESITSGYRVDRWKEQPNYVEVMVEKQALEGILIPVCEREMVTFTANKGYSSLSYMYEAGKRWEEKIIEEKEVHIIYLGDHDPSGIDMTRDIEDRGAMFANSTEIKIHRVALNMDQIRQLNPPENPAKVTDSRAASYIRRFGRSSWELDAVEPRQLDRLVTEAIEHLRDGELWEMGIEREVEIQKELNKFAAKFRE